MGERGRVRRDRAGTALGSLLAFCLVKALQHVQHRKRALEEAGNAARFISLEPRLAAYAVLVLVGE